MQKLETKINNKTALNKLQKNITTHFSNIDKLEAKKTFDASFKAYSIGLLSCVFLALSVFLITGMITLGSLTFPLQILFGGIGIVLCIPPYFVYRNTLTLKSEQLDPIIDDEYEKISNICEEAHLLIK